MVLIRYEIFIKRRDRRHVDVGRRSSDDATGDAASTVTFTGVRHARSDDGSDADGVSNDDASTRCGRPRDAAYRRRDDAPERARDGGTRGIDADDASARAREAHAAVGENGRAAGETVEKVWSRAVASEETETTESVDSRSEKASGAARPRGRVRRRDRWAVCKRFHRGDEGISKWWVVGKGEVRGEVVGRRGQGVWNGGGERDVEMLGAAGARGVDGGVGRRGVSKCQGEPGWGDFGG